MPPADTPALDDAEFGQAPIEVPNESSLAIEQAIEQEEEIPPASTPALEQAEEGINEEGWDLDEKEETSTQLTEPTLVDVDSDQPAPPVISSPALKARDDEGLDEVCSIHSFPSLSLRTDRLDSVGSLDRGFRSSCFPSHFKCHSSRWSKNSCSSRAFINRSRIRDEPSRRPSGIDKICRGGTTNRVCFDRTCRGKFSLANRF